jgi:pyruvate,water dikinase
MFPPFRRFLLELGKRWSERGLIEQQEDIFFLELDEIVKIAETPRSMKDAVPSRKHEFQTNQSLPWPDIVHDGVETYTRATTLEENLGSVLEGVAGSPGRVTGKSRVIRGPEEFGKLQKGEILVAPITNPVWTPLFAIAGGVITEVGGILSHGAIVAREYGIPAVMSVSSATKRLGESKMVTVDGNKGVVYLEVE